jgi:hypothetical protein
MEKSAGLIKASTGGQCDRHTQASENSKSRTPGSNGLVLLQALHEVRLTLSTGGALVIFLLVFRAAFWIGFRF